MRTIPRLAKEIYLASRWWLVVKAVCTVVEAIAPALAALVSASLFGSALNVASGTADISALMRPAIAYLTLNLLRDLFGSAEAVARNAGIIERGNARFREMLYGKTAALPLIDYENAEVLNRLELAESAIADGIMPALLCRVFAVAGSSLSIAGVVAALSSYSIWLAPITVLSVIPYFVARVLRGREFYRLKVFQTKDNRKLHYLWRLFAQSRSVKEMRVLGFGRYIADKWRRLRDATEEEVWALELKEARSMLLCDALRIAGYAATIALTLVLVLNRQIPLGVFGAVLLTVMSLQNAARTVFVQCARIPEQLAFANGFFAFLDLAAADGGKTVLPSAPSEICLRDVTFSYPNAAAPAIRNINLAIKGGQRTVIVGENGSGKTTLAKLILGAYRPARGEVLVNGLDMACLDMSSFCEHVSVVAQDFTRYKLTVRENIGIADVRDIGNDARMLSLLAQVGLDRPDLDAAIGREFGGMELSGGEWQRLAIARGLFRDSSLVVLDEPTANLDPVAEHEVLSGFVRAMNGRTTIIVSHRTGLCRLADTIIVMKDGRIVETGSHAELYPRGGEYTRLYDSQAEWYAKRQQIIRQ